MCGLAANGFGGVGSLLSGLVVGLGMTWSCLMERSTGWSVFYLAVKSGRLARRLVRVGVKDGVATCFSKRRLDSRRSWFRRSLGFSCG